MQAPAQSRVTVERSQFAKHLPSRGKERRVTYASPELLLIDEVGYLSYSNRHADLLFELVSRRYGTASTVVTTNKAFQGMVGGVFRGAPFGFVF
jgi:DNA replication protein DnaC